MLSSKSRMLKLKSSDNETFEVETAAAVQSEVIKNMVEDSFAYDTITLPNVNSKTLAMVREWCEKHVDHTVTEEELKKFEADFVDVDQAVLYDLLMAASYLNIKDLLHQACKSVVDMIKEKRPEEIRKIFNIENDFTPEEEEEISKENAWALY